MAQTKKKVLVYGATGVQGGPVVRRLLQEGYQVRVLVRNSSKAEQFRQAGAEIAVGDFNNRESLIAANEKVDSVFLILPLRFDSEVITYGRNAIDAATSANVSHLVFNTSVLVPDSKVGVKALDLKRDVEDYLRQSDVPNIILRPTFYMENLAAPWSAPSILQQGVVAYPMTRDFQASWISVEDVAAFAVELIKHPELAGSVFNVGGPEVLTGNDIAQRFATVLDRAVNFFPIPLDEFEQQMNGAMGKPVGTEIAALYRWFIEQPQSPAAIAPSQIIQKLNLQLTPMEQWIRAQDWSPFAQVSVSQTA